MAKRREIDQTSFLYGGNSSFIEELYARYLADPAQVDPSWRAYFDELEPDNRALFERARAALQPPPARLRLVESAPAAQGPTASLDEAATKALIRDHLRVIMLIRAYRVRGHLIANLDPLGLTHKEQHPELDYRSYGFSDAEITPGARSVGAPVYNADGDVQYSLVISAPSLRLTDDRVPQFVNMVCRGAAALSRALGHAAPAPAHQPSVRTDS